MFAFLCFIYPDENIICISLKVFNYVVVVVKAVSFLDFDIPTFSVIVDHLQPCCQTALHSIW